MRAVSFRPIADRLPNSLRPYVVFGFLQLIHLSHLSPESTDLTLHVTSKNIPDPLLKKNSERFLTPDLNSCSSSYSYSSFYSQGRCVFVESCGFFHDVKVKGTVGRQFTTVSRDAKSLQDPISPVDSVIEAIQTTAVHSPTSPSSPPSSPRMTSSDLQGNTELSASAGEKLLCDTL